jgi:hypothetical protein
MLKLTDNLGFFFSFYKEKTAVIHCLENIRTYYKENPIYLSSDGGFDFSELTNEYSNLKFILNDDVLGYVNNPETKNKEILILCAIEFLNRLKNAVDYCNKEYIIYYEPDVFLRGHIRINDDLHLNGSYANEIHKNVMQKINDYNPKNINKNFGACGGSIIRCDTFQDVYKKATKEVIADLIYADSRISNCDYLLVVLFSIFGYKYDQNLDFVEAGRTSWENSQHSIVHQYRHNYINDYQGKYKI